jgi:hypothetical protein
MNLFRSEDHVRNWSRFDPAAEQGIVPLSNLVGLFSGDFFRRRGEPGYASQNRKYWRAVLDILGEMAREHPFWSPPKR